MRVRGEEKGPTTAKEDPVAVCRACRCGSAAVKGEQGWLQPDPNSSPEEQLRPRDTLNHVPPVLHQQLALLHSWNQRFSSSSEKEPDCSHGLAETEPPWSKQTPTCSWLALGVWGHLWAGCTWDRRGHLAVVSPPGVPTATEVLSELRNALTHKGRSHSFTWGVLALSSSFPSLPRRLELSQPAPGCQDHLEGCPSARPPDRLSRARGTLHLNWHYCSPCLSITRRRGLTTDSCNSSHHLLPL